MSGRVKPALRGVVVSLNTPFDAAGRLDFDSFARSIEMHLSQGAAAFWRRRSTSS